MKNYIYLLWNIENDIKTHNNSVNLHNLEINYKGFIVKNTFEGELNLENLTPILTDLKNILPEKVAFLLSDFRNAKINIDINKITSAINAVKQNFSYTKRIFEAILVDVPDDTARFLIYELSNNNEFHTIKIFSTEEEAINWLKVQKHLNVN